MENTEGSLSSFSSGKSSLENTFSSDSLELGWKEPPGLGCLVSYTSTP